MDFFDSISVSFYLWQLICLSPFRLRNNQMNSNSNNSYRMFSLVVILIQVLAILFCATFLNHIVYAKLPQVIQTLDTTILFLAQLTALIIFIESYKKRFVQTDFLRTINTIDFILEYKIGIQLNYSRRKRANIKRLFRWLILNFLVFIINLVLLYNLYQIAYRWWIVIYASFFICSLRYHQISSYVDIIDYRYHQINRYLNGLQFVEENHNKFNMDLTKTLNVHTIFQKYKTKCIDDKLNDLQRVCLLLNAANRSINEMFQWSFPLILVSDFLQTIINSYWSLRIIFSAEIKLKHLISPLLWTLLNMNHFISLAFVCHRATAEVILIFI